MTDFLFLKYMKKATISILLLFFSLVSVGCTATNYYAKTGAHFSPKPLRYDVPFYKGTPILESPYRVIGRFEVRGDTSSFATWDSLLGKAKEVARGRGADAVINVESDYQEYNSVVFIPWLTTIYRPVTSYPQRGTSPDARSSSLGSNYDGALATSVPLYAPPTTMPDHAAVLYYRGDLIVFTGDKKEIVVRNSEHTICLADDKWQCLKVDMTPKQVSDLLGRPEKRISNATSQEITWRYKNSGKVTFFYDHDTWDLKLKSWQE